MKQLVTPAIILTRTDYGEADRIITMITPEYGKVRLLAKGVRRVKSKLAGGIELFSVSTITYIQGRGELGTLVSTRLNRHYRHIVADLDRTMLGYELIKQCNKVTEDQAESGYFTLLEQTFVALDATEIPLELIRFWFLAQLLRLGGREPNLRSDAAGVVLQAGRTYAFSLEDMCFAPREHGRFAADHIKLLRLAFAGTAPNLLAKVQGAGDLVRPLLSLMQTAAREYLDIKF